MNFSDVISALTVEHSGYAVAKKLGITPTTFYKYKNGHKTPSDDVLEKMIDITGIPAHQVYLAAYAEKLTNPKVAEHFRHLAA
jgi:transcriptional regulator with XRE-family HTH domain